GGELQRHGPNPRRHRPQYFRVGPTPVRRGQPPPPPPRPAAPPRRRPPPAYNRLVRNSGAPRRACGDHPRFGASVRFRSSMPRPLRLA
ncbi:hypothetical protein YH64_028210, partial [Achromobacter sp. LC458]